MEENNTYTSDIRLYDKLEELQKKRRKPLAMLANLCLIRIKVVFIEISSAMTVLEKYLFADEFNEGTSFWCYYYIDDIYHRTYVINEMVFEIVKVLFMCRRYYKFDIGKRDILKKLEKTKRYKRIYDLFCNAKQRFSDMFKRRHSMVHRLFGTAKEEIRREIILFGMETKIGDEKMKKIEKHLEYSKLLEEYKSIKKDITDLMHFFFDFCEETHRMIKKL